MKVLVGGPSPVAAAAAALPPAGRRWPRRKSEHRSSCRTSLTSALSLSDLSEFSLDAPVNASPDENPDRPQPSVPAGAARLPLAGARPYPPKCVLDKLEQLDSGSSRDMDDEAESSRITRSSSEDSLSIGNLKEERMIIAEKSVRDWSRRGLSFAADTGPSGFLVDSDDSLSFLDSDASLDWYQGGDAASRNENEDGDADGDGDDGDGDGDGNDNDNDNGNGGDKRDRSGSCDVFEDQLRQMEESCVVTSRNDGAAAANARRSDRLKILSWSQTYSHAIEEGDEESSLGSLGPLDSSGEEEGERGQKAIVVM